MKKNKTLIFFIIVLIGACNHNSNDNQSSFNQLEAPPVKLKTETKLETKPQYEVLREITLPYKMAALPDKDAMAQYVANYDKNPIKGDIIIFFVDTLRYDMAMKYAPTVRRFMSETLSGKHIASGTSTVYAIYSMFHSQPGFLAYKDYLSTAYNETDRGSLFFQLLKKQGYNIYAFGQFFSCWTSDLTRQYLYRKTENISFFGHNTHLLSNCSEEHYAGYPATFNTNQIGQVSEDQLKIDRFKEIYEKNQETGQVGLYIIEQYNVHGHYKWTENHSKLPYPNLEYLNGKFTGSGVTTEKSYKAYANAVYDVDQKFKEIINYLINKGNYNNTTLAFVSDHGESLREKKTNHLSKPTYTGEIFGHGESLNREELTAIYAIKFNKEANISYNSLQYNHIGSIDFLPTIFDGLGYELNDAKEFYQGGAVFQNSHQTEHISVLPNGTSPTRRLCITNDQYKVHLLIDDKDFYEADKFKIIGIHTLDDEPITDNYEKDRVINNFETLFSKGINKISPKKQSILNYIIIKKSYLW